MEENYYGFDYWRAGQTLAHHGIKGQKWGVRRYQNSDGSLTAAGRKRYGTSLKKTFNRVKNTIHTVNKRVSSLNPFVSFLNINPSLSMTQMTNNHATIQRGMEISQQMSNQSAINASINASTNASINATHFANSMAITGGMTPFAFGIM